jgi:hypothetical protein
VADEQLKSVWGRPGAHLDRARAFLTDPQDDALVLFDEFRDHNELGLALDQMADIAEAQRAPRAVWKELSAAAGVMRLGEGDAVYGGAVRRINEHLARAGDWEELRQLLNEWDPIGVYDRTADFPPDEYDCLSAPLMGLLVEGADIASVADFLGRELSGHFGLDPRPSRPEEFAARLVEWFRGSGNLSDGGDSQSV